MCQTLAPLGGGSVYFLKSVRKGRFRNGLGGGVRDTFKQRSNGVLHSCRRAPWYPLFLVYLCHCACLTFFSKLTSMQVAKNSCCDAFVGCAFQSQNSHEKAVASADIKIWCFLWVHAGCCEPAVRAFFAWLPSRCRAICTHSAPPKRALLRTKGFCGASRKATACGVNLYADMVAAC